jgi:hypothetical protein
MGNEGAEIVVSQPQLPHVVAAKTLNPVSTRRLARPRTPEAFTFRPM